MIRKIEIGKEEKHVIEFRNNPWTGVEGFWIDGKCTLSEFSLWGIDREFEVGEKEKHKIRIKAGYLEQLNLKPLFFIDGIAYDSKNIDSRSKLHQAALFAGILGGFLAGWYAGFGLSVLLFAWLLLLFIFKNKFSMVFAAFLLQAVYASWFVLSFLYIRQPIVIFDILVLCGLGFWLLIRPGLLPLLSIGIFHALVLVGNFVQILQMPFGSDDHKAVFTHAILRIFSILFATLGVFETQKGKQSVPVLAEPLNRSKSMDVKGLRNIQKGRV